MSGHGEGETEKEKMSRRSRIPSFVLVAAALLAVVAAARAECTCAVARLANGWCDECGVGYVGSAKIPSKLLYEELDPHGHPFDPAKLRCETCRTAIEEDGFCELHRRGFVGGQAYLTPLAWRLARGTHLDPVALECPVCRENARSHGWCDACERGMVGHVAIDRRADYEAVAAEYEILLEAIDRASTCEACAVAMVFDGTCPRCGLTYRDGEATPVTTTAP
jgi:hypothetical protein